MLAATLLVVLSQGLLLRQAAPLALGRSPDAITARQAVRARTAAPQGQIGQVPTRDGGKLETATSLGDAAVSGEIEYGGIRSVGVIVDSASEALKFYTEVLLMEDVTSVEQLDQPGAAVRCGAQIIHLMEVPNPDPALGRPDHAGRDRHTALTVNGLQPLKAALEAADWKFTMSMSGRQALFCRDSYGNGWEFGPPTTYENATRLYPPYMLPSDTGSAPLVFGGIPHVGLLVSSTPHAKVFYVDVLGMRDETDLRPVKLPFPVSCRFRPTRRSERRGLGGVAAAAEGAKAGCMIHSRLFGDGTTPVARGDAS